MSVFDFDTPGVRNLTLPSNVLKGSRSRDLKTLIIYKVKESLNKRLYLLAYKYD